MMDEAEPAALMDEAERAELIRENEWLERERARFTRADEVHRVLSKKVTEAFPFEERWRPFERRSEGMVPRAGLWEIAAAEITGWCEERWGAPAVITLRPTDYLDHPNWNPLGTWAMIGASMSFATAEQAMEFKLRWHSPR